MHFHEAILKARVKLNLTKACVARDLGLPYTTYDSYEKGHRMPRPKTAIKIIRYFNIDIGSLYLEDAKSIDPYVKYPPHLDEVRAHQAKLMKEYFDRLNTDGRRRAISIISDLSEIEKYTTPDIAPKKDVPINFMEWSTLPDWDKRKDELYKKWDYEPLTKEQITEAEKLNDKAEREHRYSLSGGDLSCPGDQHAEATEAEPSGKGLTDVGKPDTP